MFSVDGNSIVLPHKSIRFDHPVKPDALVNIGDILVVVLDVIGKVRMNRNVFGVSISSGTIIWQIDDLWPEEDSPFTGAFERDHMVDLYNWSGFIAKIDSQTGAIISKTFTH